MLFISHAYLSVIDVYFHYIAFGGHILYDFQSPKFIEVSFMAMDMIYLSICFHGHLKRICILLFWGGVFHKYQLDPFD